MTECANEYTTWRTMSEADQEALADELATDDRLLELELLETGTVSPESIVHHIKRLEQQHINDSDMIRQLIALVSEQRELLAETFAKLKQIETRGYTGFKRNKPFDRH